MCPQAVAAMVTRCPASQTLNWTVYKIVHYVDGGTADSASGCQNVVQANCLQRDEKVLWGEEEIAVRS